MGKESNFILSRKHREWLPNLLSHGLMTKMHDQVGWQSDIRSGLLSNKDLEITSPTFLPGTRRL